MKDLVLVAYKLIKKITEMKTILWLPTTGCSHKKLNIFSPSIIYSRIIHIFLRHQHICKCMNNRYKELGMVVTHIFWKLYRHVSSCGEPKTRARFWITSEKIRDMNPGTVVLYLHYVCFYCAPCILIKLKFLSPTNAPLYYTYKMLKYTVR